MDYVTQSTFNINSKRLNTNGGFIGYWKMTFKLWLMVFNISDLIKTFTPWKSLYMIPWLFIVMLVKTPWYLFIKPFGQIYSRKTTWVGSYHEKNGIVTGSNIKKHISHKLFGATFLKHPSAMTKADWEHIRK